MTNTVFDKTEQGREEITTRAHHLAPRLRTLLLLVDGKRDTIELMSKVSGLGLDEKALVELLENGFIEIAGAGSAAATAATSDQPDTNTGTPTDTQPPRPGSSASRRTEANMAAATPALPAPVATVATVPAVVTSPSPPADNPAMPTGAAVQGILREGETQFQALYNFFNETIRSAIGLRGYGMQLKVERAATIADFRALRQPYLDAVLKAKGPELEHSLRNRLDQLLSLGN